MTNAACSYPDLWVYVAQFEQSVEDLQFHVNERFGSEKVQSIRVLGQENVVVWEIQAADKSVEAEEIADFGYGVTPGGFTETVAAVVLEAGAYAIEVDGKDITVHRTHFVVNDAELVIRTDGQGVPCHPKWQTDIPDGHVHCDWPIDE